MNTVAKWHIELTLLRRLSREHELGLHSEQPNVYDLSDGDVGQLGLEAVTLIEKRPTISDAGDYVGPSITYPDAPHVRYPLRNCGYLIQRDFLPVFIVNLDAMDGEILDEVQRKLQEFRRHKGLIRTTGKHSISRPFKDRHTFSKWRKHRINELAELLAWRKQLPLKEQRNFPDRVLGDWIDKDPKETSAAIKVLREAIAALPAIFPEDLQAKLVSQPH